METTPKKRNPPRRYSDDERATALAALESNGGNVEKTHRDTGIPAQTIRQWAGKNGRGVHSDVTRLSSEKKLELSDLFENVVRSVIPGLSEAATEATFKDRTIGIGVLVDKMQLLRGAPTVIQRNQTELPDDDPSNLTIEQLREELAKAERFAGGAGETQTRVGGSMAEEVPGIALSTRAG
jgi:transposase-like protein